MIVDVRDDPGVIAEGDAVDAETEKSPGSIWRVTVAPSLCAADVVLAKETQQYVVPTTTPTEMESLWTDVSIGTSQFTRSYILASAAHAWKGVLVYCPLASLK